MKLIYNQHLKKYSRVLRNESTLSEVLLWGEIKGKKLGCQFLRQRPIGKYIVDFYCFKLNLAIEIDGVSHESKIERDEMRDETLEQAGIRIIRFRDEDVKNNLESVVREIRDYVENNGKSLGSGTRHSL